MTRPLHKRLGDPDEDSVASFERAATKRFRDAESLRDARRWAAAIYLYGYAVEMWIKAAYFRAVFANLGRPASSRITHQMRRQAEQFTAPQLLNRPIRPHEIRGWAELLVAQRNLTNPYPSALAQKIIGEATIIYLSWREYMRYRPAHGTPREALSVRTAARWFRASYPIL